MEPGFGRTQCPALKPQTLPGSHAWVWGQIKPPYCPASFAVTIICLVSIRGQGLLLEHQEVTAPLEVTSTPMSPPSRTSSPSLADHRHGALWLAWTPGLQPPTVSFHDVSVMDPQSLWATKIPSRSFLRTGSTQGPTPRNSNSVSQGRSQEPAVFTSALPHVTRMGVTKDHAFSKTALQTFQVCR